MTQLLPVLWLGRPKAGREARRHFLFHFSHGKLNKIFAQVVKLQQEVPVDLLVISGDFQAVRNSNDMQSLHVPEKYSSLGDFHEYYAGLKSPPCPVLFIGGNHEASNYQWELYHGGWASKDIYFIGYAGLVKFGGIRIAGISGHL